jgi:hypothetical protein
VITPSAFHATLVVPVVYASVVLVVALAVVEVFVVVVFEVDVCVVGVFVTVLVTVVVFVTVLFTVETAVDVTVLFSVTVRVVVTGSDLHDMLGTRRRVRIKIAEKNNAPFFLIFLLIFNLFSFHICWYCTAYLNRQFCIMVLRIFIFL